ncbi:MAG: SAM-dependent methyltransferase [Rhizobiales bacterium 65-79]|jgi:SAM-dependent methyltransferase|nr:class I SAM-dependent methyltransferase [Hyphomicrobiales bacterium]OJU04332.1 MAG: SAM-dependent methyltransferase [Rhizobiales bacterium 65-79]
MAQNIYDEPGFFGGYSRLERSVHGLAGAAEWPVLRSMLPAIAGLRVIDLGCGYGWFCRWAAENGASTVLGLDISEKMLDRARAATDDDAISYRRANLDELTLPPEAFDLAYSSLAFHYVEDAERLYRTIHHALVPGGRLVFSTEHPIFMASSHSGWMTKTDGSRTWPVDGYSVEGRRVIDWLGAGVVKYHRTVATTVNLLIRAGFRILRLEEFCPTAEQIEANPALAEEVDRPMFLMIAAEK